METNSRLAWQLFAGFVFVLTAALLPIFPGKTVVQGPQTVSLHNAQQLALACKLYAGDHEGRFPVHLSELEPDYIADVKGLRGIVFGPDGKEESRYDWLYFGAGFTESDPPTVFLASPQLVVTPGKPQKRAIVKSDTMWVFLKESEYEKLLSETVRQMRALDDSLHPAKLAPGDSPAK